MKKIAVVTTNRADYDQIFWLISELKKKKDFIKTGCYWSTLRKTIWLFLKSN